MRPGLLHLRSPQVRLARKLPPRMLSHSTHHGLSHSTSLPKSSPFVSLPAVPNRLQIRWNSSTPTSKSSSSVRNATDISHSTFISSASPSSDFNPLQTPSAGQVSSPDNNPNKGHLTPTKSHLFKLILPLPASLSNLHDSKPRVPTAFLLHPSQPLSHLSRLISGSLPPGERDVEIRYLATTGPEEDVDTRLRNAEEGEKELREMDVESHPEKMIEQEGGPMLGERIDKKGKYQEVSWSSSTDLSDFIKQSCLDEKFKIEIKREGSESDRSGEEGREGVLTMEVVIPSFASRTTYLRARLLRLTRELDKMTKKKKAIDLVAHKGAQRLAVIALGIGVAYWVAVIRWTFFTTAGWDMMEPVTWATGFGTLLCSAAFLVYHNREVSYSSLLDLSVTARQKALYDKHGLDIEQWTEMVSEAKTLRKEIARIAADYDIQWQGELENLERDSKPVTQTSNHSTTTSDSKNEASSPNNNPNAIEEEEPEEKLDIDATIDEASEMASQSKEKQAKEKAAQRKGEVVDERDENGDHDPKKKSVREDSESEVRGKRNGERAASGQRSPEL